MILIMIRMLHPPLVSKNILQQERLKLFKSKLFLLEMLKFKLDMKLKAEREEILLGHKLQQVM